MFDVGLDIVGDHLARLDHLVQEAPEIRLGALGLAIVLRAGYLDDLLEQGGCFFLGRDRWGGRLGGRLGFCGTHDFGSSGWGCDPAWASSTRATAVAFS